MSGLAARFLLQHRHRSDGRRAQDGPLARAQSSPENSRSSRWKTRSTDARFGALSVTGQPKYRQDFEPLVPGVKFVPANDPAALEAAFSERTAGIIDRVDPGRGRHLSDDPRIRDAKRGSWRIATTRCWCPTKRNAAWAGRARTSPISWRTTWCCRTSWWRPSRGMRTPAGRSSWPTRRRRRRSGRECTALLSAAARWPAAWRWNS